MPTVELSQKNFCESQRLSILSLTNILSNIYQLPIFSIRFSQQREENITTTLFLSRKALASNFDRNSLPPKIASFNQVTNLFVLFWGKERAFLTGSMGRDKRSFSKGKNGMDIWPHYFYIYSILNVFYRPSFFIFSMEGCPSITY